MKVFALECQGNIAVAINGNRREDFKKGDIILVGREEYLICIRLGFTLIEEIDLKYEDISKKSKKKEENPEKAQKKEKKEDENKA